MTLTESEAQTKWCPLVRAQIYSGGSTSSHPAVNRDDIDLCCIGSQCMLWQWEASGLWQWEASGLPISDPKGYCGLTHV